MKIVSKRLSLFIIDVDVSWQMVFDLLLVCKTKSENGGLGQEMKETIEKVPHVLIIDEAFQLQQFFMLVATGNVAKTLDVNFTYPTLN